jgi:hypothetical protein
MKKFICLVVCLIVTFPMYAYGIGDLLSLLADFGCVSLSGNPENCDLVNGPEWDLNGDWQVNILDLLILLDNWG